MSVYKRERKTWANTGRVTQHDFPWHTGKVIIQSSPLRKGCRTGAWSVDQTTVLHLSVWKYAWLLQCAYKGEAIRSTKHKERVRLNTRNTKKGFIREPETERNPSSEDQKHKDRVLLAHLESEMAQSLELYHSFTKTSYCRVARKDLTLQSDTNHGLILQWLSLVKSWNAMLKFRSSFM